MAYTDLRVEIDAGIAVLTLARPDHRNAFSGPMATSLAEAYRECDGRDDVRAVELKQEQDAGIDGTIRK